MGNHVTKEILIQQYRPLDCVPASTTLKECRQQFSFFHVMCPGPFFIAEFSAPFDFKKFQMKYNNKTMIIAW